MIVVHVNKYIELVVRDCTLVAVLGIVVGGVNQHQAGQGVLIGAHILHQPREEVI